MRCNSLLLAGLLPVVFGQSGISAGTGVAAPTGGHDHGRPPIAVWGNDTRPPVLPLPTGRPGPPVLPLPSGKPVAPVNLPTSNSSRWNASQPTLPNGPPHLPPTTLPSQGGHVSAPIKNTTSTAGHVFTSIAKRSVVNFTPALNTTRPASTPGPLPITTSKYQLFVSSTASGVTVPTSVVGTGGAAHFPGTGFFSRPHPTGTGYLPNPVSSAAGPTNKTSTAQPSPTVVLSAGVSASLASNSSTAVIIPNTISVRTEIPSGKPTSVLFTNSTASLASSTGTFSGTGRPTILPTKPITISTSSSAISSPSIALPTVPSLPPLPPTTLPTTFATPTTMITSSIPLPVTSSSIIPVPTYTLPPTQSLVPHYHQCGGIFYKGPKQCVDGLYCKYWNLFYSQCLKKKF